MSKRCPFNNGWFFFVSRRSSVDPRDSSGPEGPPGEVGPTSAGDEPQEEEEGRRGQDQAVHSHGQGTTTDYDGTKMIRRTDIL